MLFQLRDLGEGKTYLLTGLLKQIGRSPEADIMISDSRVSRLHARLEKTEKGWVILDLESKNGTRVNGELVKEKLLSSGDVIQIGPVRLVYEPAPEPETQGEDTKIEPQSEKKPGFFAKFFKRSNEK